MKLCDHVVLILTGPGISRSQHSGHCFLELPVLYKERDGKGTIGNLLAMASK